MSLSPLLGSPAASEAARGACDSLVNAATGSSGNAGKVKAAFECLKARSQGTASTQAATAAAFNGASYSVRFIGTNLGSCVHFWADGTVDVPVIPFGNGAIVPADYAGRPDLFSAFFGAKTFLPAPGQQADVTVVGLTVGPFIRGAASLVFTDSNQDPPLRQTAFVTFTGSRAACFQTLTVNKVCQGTSTGTFDIKVDGVVAPNGSNVGCDGSTGLLSVSAGSHTVSEEVLTGGPFTTSFSAECPLGEINVPSGQDVTCTITNTLATPP